MIYQIEKMLKEQGEKISGSDRGDVENALADAKKAVESNDKAQMEKARETLTAASHKLAEQMYKSAQSQPAPGADQRLRQELSREPTVRVRRKTKA